MATIVFPVGNIMVRGIVVCMVAGSFAASLQLINDRMTPVYNIAGTENTKVWIGTYKRPYYILMLLNYELSPFPAYFMSTGYISFPAPAWCL